MARALNRGRPEHEGSIEFGSDCEQAGGNGKREHRAQIDHVLSVIEARQPPKPGAGKLTNRLSLNTGSEADAPQRILNSMSNRRNLGRALECFADPLKRQEYFQLYSHDIILHGYEGVEPGLDSVKQFYRGFWDAFPDARVAAQEIIEQEQTVVVRHLTTGTQEKAFMGVPAAGQRIELPGISILHFRDGQCFERWTCSDPLLLLKQIGGFPIRGRP